MRELKLESVKKYFGVFCCEREREKGKVAKIWCGAVWWWWFCTCKEKQVLRLITR